MMEIEQNIIPLPTVEQDMDLIEVLWRQDIDLGVGREVFDLNLRKELEKEKELELEKQREKDKQEAEEHLKQEQQQQQQAGIEYVVDGETGELVPVPVGSAPQMAPHTTMQPEFSNTEEQQQQSSQEEEMPSIDDMMRILEERVDNGPLPNITTLPDTNLTTRVHQELQTLLQQTEQPEQMELERSGSFDQSWQDMSELLRLNSMVENDTSGTDSQLDVAPMTGNAPPDALVQNASLVPHGNYSFTQDLGVAGFPPTYPDVGTMAGPGVVTNTAPVIPQNITLPPPDPALLQLDNQDLFQNLTGLPPQNISLPRQDEYLRDLLEDDLDSLDFSELFLNDSNAPLLPQTTMMVPPQQDDASSDSAVSSMGSSAGSPLQDFYDGVSTPPSQYEGLEGATGGTEASAPTKVQPKFEKNEPDYSQIDYGYSGEVPMNTSSNGTHFDTPMGSAAADMRQVSHNHSYPLQPGQQPKDMSSQKRSVKATVPQTSGSHSNSQPAYSTRDQKRAKAMGIPFSCDEIIHSPVERFNDMLTKYSLDEPQLQLIRDIRRRGKNKVAAQNCRKRKLNVITTLDDELGTLRKERDRLQEERHRMEEEKNQVQQKYASLYSEVFRSLRDDNGHPYDPSEFSLQQTADGDVFLVPRNTSGTEQNSNSTSHKRKDRKHS